MTAVPRAIVQVVVVINIVDVRDVGNPGVGDVHAIEVAAACAIPRNERLTEPQRAPAKAPTETESEVDAPSRPAKPCDQCGSIVRTLPDRSRSPSPVAATPHPTPIMERSVAPRLSFDPCPPPRLFPNPVAVVIR